MSSGEVLFTVGPPPHRRSLSSISLINYAYIAALFPAAAIGAILYGMGPEGAQYLPVGTGLFSRFVEIMLREMGVDPWVLTMVGAFGVLLLAMGAGILVEYITQIIFRQPYHALNGHGALMGLIMAMMVPAGIPWWVLLMGVMIAIILGKQLYGGIGAYPFHPALVGLLVLLVAYPHHVALVGSNSMGSVHLAVIILTMLGGLGLVALGLVKWQVPLGVILGVAVFGGIFKFVYPEIDCPLEQLFTGHVMLAAFFISTDNTSSPANSIPAIIFGLGVGAMIMLIRVYGIWADAIPFAVILMNIMNPLLDRIRPKVKQVVQNG